MPVLIPMPDLPITTLMELLAGVKHAGSVGQGGGGGGEAAGKGKTPPTFLDPNVPR